MPKVGGPRQKGRALLAPVAMSVLMYGIAIWAGTLRYQITRDGTDSVFFQKATRIAFAF